MKLLAQLIVLVLVSAVTFGIGCGTSTTGESFIRVITATTPVEGKDDIAGVFQGVLSRQKDYYWIRQGTRAFRVQYMPIEVDAEQYVGKAVALEATLKYVDAFASPPEPDGTQSRNPPGVYVYVPAEYVLFDVISLKVSESASR